MVTDFVFTKPAVPEPSRPFGFGVPVFNNSIASTGVRPVLRIIASNDSNSAGTCSSAIDSMPPSRHTRPAAIPISCSNMFGRRHAEQYDELADYPVSITTLFVEAKMDAAKRPSDPSDRQQMRQLALILKGICNG